MVDASFDGDATASALSIDAENELTNYVFGIGGNSGTGFTVNGVVTYVDIDNKTTAFLSQSSAIVADNIKVRAEDELHSVNVAGGVALGRSAGVGITGAYQTVSRDTQSIVGGIHKEIDVVGATLSEGINELTNWIDLGYEHGFQKGDRVRYTPHSENSVVDGLEDGGLYYVQSLDPEKQIRLSRSIVEADKKFDEGDIDSNGFLDLGYDHGFQTGDRVIYSDTANTGLTYKDAGVEEQLESGTIAYIRRVPGSTTKVGLALSRVNALDGNTLFLVGKEGAQPSTHSLRLAISGKHAPGNRHSLGRVFDPQYQVRGLANSIDLGQPHGFVLGQSLVYFAGGGVAIGGLQEGETYYAVPDADNPNWFQVAKTAEHAELPIPLTIDLTAKGVGDLHGFASPFEAQVTVDSDTNLIDLGYAHGLRGGDLLVYDNGNGVSISGLEDGKSYRVSVYDDTSIRFIQDADLDSRLVSFSNDTWSDGRRTLTGASALLLLNQDVVLDSLKKTITFEEPHGLSDNDVVTYSFHSRNGVEDTSGLSNGTTYHVLVVDAGTIQLLSDPLTFVDLAEPGEGVAHTLRVPFESIVAVSVIEEGQAHSIDLGYEHGFALGDAVIYSNGDGSSVGGLAHKNTYYVIPTGSRSLRLAKTYRDALAGKAIQLDGKAASGAEHAIGATFRAVQIVDSSTNEIRFDELHGFSDNEPIVYRVGEVGNSAIGGLDDNETYYVEHVDNFTIKLWTHEEGSSNRSLVELDGVISSGVGHQLSKRVPSDGSITVSGAFEVYADTIGSVQTGTLAAAKTATAEEGDDQAEETPAGSTWGLAISGSVSINDIVETTRAEVVHVSITGNSSVADSSKKVSVVSKNDTDNAAIAGAFAVSLNKSGSTSVGLAGAVSISDVTVATNALLSNITFQEVGDVLVDSRTTGTTRSVAAGLGVATNGVGVAGSVAINAIDSTTTAKVRGGSIEASGLEVFALDVSRIIAVAGAISYGGKAGVGVGVAYNEIVGGATATLSGTVVDVGFGKVSVTAKNESVITSVAAAVSASVSSQKEGDEEEGDEQSPAQSSTAVALAGGFSINVITSDTIATLENSGTTQSPMKASSVNVSATDEKSQISGIAGGIAVGISTLKNKESKGSSTGVAAGVSFVWNEIDQVQDAMLSNVVLDVDDSLSVASEANAEVFGLAIAGALAVGVSSRNPTYAVAGVGSGVINKVRGGSRSRIRKSTVNANGDVIVESDDVRSIDARAGGVSLALSPRTGDGQSASTSVSAGAAFAVNEITNASRRDESVTEVFGVKASVSESEVKGDGNITVTAVTAADVFALTIAGAGAGGGGGGNGAAVTLSGAGAGSDNTIDIDVQASADRTPIDVEKNLMVETTNTADINSQSYGVALGIGAVKGDGTAFTLSIGMSLAYNTIDIRQEAFIRDQSIIANGAVTVASTDSSAIDAVSIAASVAGSYSKDSNAFALSGGGAAAENRISGKTNAFVENATITNTGSQAINVTATADGFVDAKVIAITAGGSKGSAAGALSIGGAKTVNLIQNVDGTAVDVRAYLQDTDIQATGDLQVQAISSQTIDADVTVASVAFSYGKAWAKGLSGAGAESVNHVKANVAAEINGGADGPKANVSAQNVQIRSSDASSIDAWAGVGSVAMSYQGKHKGSLNAGLSVGVSLAENLIDGDVVAKVDQADIKTTGSFVLESVSARQQIEEPTFETGEGLKVLKAGDTVRLSDDYAVDGKPAGKPGRVYEYRGFRADYDADAVDHLSTDGVVKIYEDEVVKDSTDRVWRYLGSDNDGDGVELNLGGQSFADSDNWEAATLFVKKGTVVLRDGTFYQCSRDESEADLSDSQLYGSDVSTKLFREIDAPNKFDLRVTDYSDTRLWMLADGSIDAAAGAISVSIVGGGSTAISLSGAGTRAENVILTRTNAFAKDSSIDAGGSVQINAKNDAFINASVLTVSAALAIGKKNTFALTVGGAQSANYIGWTQDGVRKDAEVRAYLDNSEVKQSESLALDAASTGTIDADVLAGSLAVSGLSGAGIEAVNKVATDIHASIDAYGAVDKPVIKTDGELKVTASDDADIAAFAGAVFSWSDIRFLT